MIYKRVFAFAFSVIMACSLTSCQSKTISIEKSPSALTETESSAFLISNSQTTCINVSEVASSSKAVESESTTNSASLTTSPFNPMVWTKSEIIEAYKKAAKESHTSVKSKHSVTLTKISINGEELGGGFDFIKKIISAFISNNTEDTQGITGGYENLVEADVSRAEAYKVGSNTVIEMVMHEQTDGAKADIHGGSVGHAIDVVGDIGAVTNELTELGLPIEISSETTTIHYMNPTIKVIIDGNGKIISGTWQYTVEIKLKDYKAFGADVSSSAIVMDNVITVE